MKQIKSENRNRMADEPQEHSIPLATTKILVLIKK